MNNTSYTESDTGKAGAVKVTFMTFVLELPEALRHLDWEFQP